MRTRERSARRPASNRGRALSLLVVLAVLAAACSSGPQLAGGGRRHRFRTPRGGNGGPTGSPFSPTPPSPPSGGGGTGKFRALGTLSSASVNGKCERALSCQGFQVTCPGVKAPAPGLLGTIQASNPHGVVVFFSAGYGNSWWGTTNEGSADQTLQSLSQQGLTVVLVRWIVPWLDASPGEEVGPAALGCRPATVAKWVHDNVYAPLGAHQAFGVCGFCLTGDSGGASQVSYALTDYGLGPIVNAAVIASGPPHAGIAPGCLHQPSDSELWFTSFSEPIMDASYGFFHGGPCQSHDPSWASRWEADSLDTGGVSFSFPTTRIVFLFGSDDGSEGPPHGKLYAAKLEAARSSGVTSQTVSGMGHLIENYPSGLQAEVAGLLGRS